ncbi:MAG: sugar ABC transporter permease [Oscillospiraceae bacterium]|nr:sugar ABC transporter permease [Oscillospiraceae bacterium]
METGKRSLRRIRGDSWENRQEWFMLIPFLLFFIIFTVLPVLASIVLSFTDFNMLQAPEFVSLNNYSSLFLDDDVFLIAVKNTLIFGFLTGPASYFLCLIFAWLINELPGKLRTLMTLIFYAPSIAGNIFVIWTAILSGDRYGLFNSVLLQLGFIDDPVMWLTNPKYTLGVVIVVQLWLSLGVGFLSFIAGFQGIDTSIYDAGAVDGIKNRFQELVYLTLPSMAPMLLFGAVMQISSSFGVGSVSAALVGNPSTDYSAHTVVLHMQDYGTTRYEMGYACAIAVVLFIAMILTNTLIKKILSRFDT